MTDETREQAAARLGAKHGISAGLLAGGAAGEPGD